MRILGAESCEMRLCVTWEYETVGRLRNVEAIIIIDVVLTPLLTLLLIPTFAITAQYPLIPLPMPMPMLILTLTLLYADIDIDID